MTKLLDVVERYCEPCAATAERYKRIAVSMLAGGKHVSSVGGFSEARAALVYYAIANAKTIFAIPIASRSPEMSKALVDIGKFLTLFPPGGASEKPYCGPRTTKAQRKQRIKQLPLNWRDRLFDIAKESFPADAAALAILELTGLRRAELALGVHVRPCTNGLMLCIQGVKVNETRGQPVRDITVSLAHPRAAWLSGISSFYGGGGMTVQINKHRLNYVVTGTAREAFPELLDAQLPTPKTYRDQLSADLKKSCSPQEVATILGHLSENSQHAYAGSRHARGAVGWITEASTSREIKPGKHLDDFDRSLTPPSAQRSSIQSHSAGIA